MKILLTGASGLLGRTLYRELTETNSSLDVVGTAHSRTGNNLIKIDITNGDEVRQLISSLSPDLIIHAAAERRPDVVKADPAKAEKINVNATATVAEAATGYGARVLYLSTNYVFDGSNPPYYHDSETNPLNDYGKMKLAGEKIVLKTCTDPIILRIPVLYGAVEYLGESTITVIAEEISSGKPSFFDNIASRYPTHASDISKVISGMIRLIQSGQNVTGIYHCSSAKAYTKYGMAKIMADITGIDKKLIHEAEINPSAAPRPKDAGLDTGRLDALGLGNYRALEPALEEILIKN